LNITKVEELPDLSEEEIKEIKSKHRPSG